ncbi:MAG: hypothetical protein AB7U41_02400 [Dongiaceae bacterium]
METLFSPGNVNKLSRKPIRPLGSFSDFVVTMLPDQLHHCKNEADLGLLAKKIEAELASIGETNGSSTSLAINKLIRLDLIFAFTAIAQKLAGFYPDGATEVEKAARKAALAEKTAATIPLILIEAVKRYSQKLDMPTVLTYEDLILINPLDQDPRLFSTEEVGKTEIDFYRGHFLIEQALEQVIDSLAAARRDPETLLTNLQKAVDFILPLKELTAAFRDTMSTAHFAAFRGYFAVNAYNSLVGPSGRFSAKVQHVRILLDGDRLHTVSPGLLPDLFGHYDYYPVTDRANLSGDMEQRFCPALFESGKLPIKITQMIPLSRKNSTIAELVRAQGYQGSAYDLLNNIRETMDDFTGAHYAAAYRHVIQGIKASEGTSGIQDVNRFLADRFNMHEKIRKLEDGEIIARIADRGRDPR